jgi:hypothetical protein
MSRLFKLLPIHVVLAVAEMRLAAESQISNSKANPILKKSPSLLTCAIFYYVPTSGIRSVSGLGLMC